MPLLVDRLIRGKTPPLSVRVNTTVHEAVRLVYENDYSQLPVLDNRGHVVGLFTDAALTQILTSNDPKIYLNDSVSKWMTRNAEVVGVKKESMVKK
jgi:CBS domain-containing protein